MYKGRQRRLKRVSSYGNRTQFCSDVGCGDTTLKDWFFDIFDITRNKKALVVDSYCLNDAMVIIDFLRQAQDWVFGVCAFFLYVLCN